MQSVYFVRTGQCEKSLYLEKQIMQLKSKHGYENGLLVNYYNIAKSYNKLNQLDSAIRYALLCIQSIRDTSNFVNHYYYLNTAEIAEQLNMWEHSSTAYKRAYETLKNNIDKDLILSIVQRMNASEVFLYADKYTILHTSTLMYENTVKSLERQNIKVEFRVALNENDIGSELKENEKNIKIA